MLGGLSYPTRAAAIACALITGSGSDWTKRYPWIVEATLKNRGKQFVIDGKAVILAADGISDFNTHHFGKFNHEVKRDLIQPTCRLAQLKEVH